MWLQCGHFAETFFYIIHTELLGRRYGNRDTKVAAWEVEAVFNGVLSGLTWRDPSFIRMIY
jgi:hypothetical protein